MTGDERDRILGLLAAGPATVARLVEGLGLPGGVVSYQLKLLEREGLVRVGTMRTERGAATAVWVSTAAAAAPPILAPDPLPGLTWVGDDLYPIPVWTTPHPPEPVATQNAGADGTTAGAESAATARRPAEPADAAWSDDEARGAGGRTGTRGPTPLARADRPAGHDSGTTRARSAPAPQPRRPIPADAESGRGPRLTEVRRVPIDDATFYEFAGRLDALAREFAARAVPGAPATELTIALTRPTGDGQGS